MNSRRNTDQTAAEARHVCHGLIPATNLRDQILLIIHPLTYKGRQTTVT